LEEKTTISWAFEGLTTKESIYCHLCKMQGSTVQVFIEIVKNERACDC
jgi:hypothetical protein